MTVSVLVPTYRRPGDLLRCLRALAAQDRAADEVLVVARPDDAETAGALRAPGSPPHRLIPTHRPGQVAALNAGVAAATGDVVAITDDDAAPRPDWLRRIEAHFAGDPALGGLGGRDWIHEADGRVHNGVRRVVGRVGALGRVVGNHHLGAGPPREVDILKGANMSFRREALCAVGFDDRLRGRGAQVGNDMAVSLGVQRAGWRLVYDPAVAVDHHPAQRHDVDRWGPPEPEAVRAAAFNESVILLEHEGARRGPLGAVACAAYGVLVGTAALPGAGQGVRLALQRRPGAIRRTAAAVCGRAEGAWFCARALRRGRPLRTARAVDNVGAS